MGKVVHQFSLFGYQPPKLKVPFRAASLHETKALIDKGDMAGAAARLRELRENLERFERGLYNRKTTTKNNGKSSIG
jgi:hypothetical protein